LRQSLSAATSLALLDTNAMPLPTKQGWWHVGRWREYSIKQKSEKGRAYDPAFSSLAYSCDGRFLAVTQ
jgi:hypothetical protein